jgi:hypothetical protein
MKRSSRNVAEGKGLGRPLSLSLRRRNLQSEAMDRRRRWGGSDFIGSVASWNDQNAHS